MLQIVLMIISTLLVGFWGYLHFSNKSKFDDIMSGIDDKDYPASKIYYIGFGFMKLIRFDMETKSARRRIKSISEVYGKKYAVYYYYVLMGAKFTFVLTFIPVSLALAVSAGENIAILAGVLLTGLLIWYLDEKVNDKVMERHDELLKAYPQMLSKLTLLVNSGMPIREAWIKIANSNTGILYSEMKLTEEELRNGISEIEAYKAFGERCSVKPLKKFSSMMLQNLQKGSAEVVSFLKEMGDDAWEEKKHMVKRKGELASTKLMLPIGMIFIGILMIIMVPMLSAF